MTNIANVLRVGNDRRHRFDRGNGRRHPAGCQYRFNIGNNTFKKFRLPKRIAAPYAYFALDIGYRLCRHCKCNRDYRVELVLISDIVDK